MEDPNLVAAILNGDKFLHEVEAKAGKKVNFIHALMEVEQHIYSYFLDQAPLKLGENTNIINEDELKKFNTTVKDMLRKDYIDHSDIVKEISSFVMDFVMTLQKNVIANLSSHNASFEVVMYKMISAMKEFKTMFFYIYGPGEVSLKTLKTEIDKLACTSDDAFHEILLKSRVFFASKSISISIKNNIVRAYQQYFKKVEENFKTAQRLLPDLTMDDFDAYRTQVAKFKKNDPQKTQVRYVIELLRLHALYPQYQSVLVPLILRKCEAKPIDTNDDFFGIGKNVKWFPKPKDVQMTLPIQLPQVAEELRQEGLQPPHMKSMLINRQIVTPLTDVKKRLFENTVKTFLAAENVLSEFEDCFRYRQYRDKNVKLIATEKGENILRKAKSLADYNAAFQLMAPYVNRHKNFKWDSFFGNDITRTWNKIIKQIREPAITALLNEINDVADIDEKIIRLKEACEMPLFNQHRNNHWYTGAVGDTHSVKIIKNEIAKLEALKNQSLISLKQ
jgi:hypothetical protein